MIDASYVVEEDQVFVVLKLADRLDLTQDEQGQLAALLRKWEEGFLCPQGRLLGLKHCIGYSTGDAAPLSKSDNPKVALSAFKILGYAIYMHRTGC